MKPLNESVALSMDCHTPDVVPFLPYILQDFIELGSRTSSLTKIIGELKSPGKIHVLDLGCGKGAITMAIAETFDSDCLGLDAMGDFIIEAELGKKRKNIANCRFMVGDIRELSFLENAYDFIVLGSVGPIFESYAAALNSFRQLLKDNGRILLDEGYMEEGRVHPVTLGKSELFEQIARAGLWVEKEYKGEEISPPGEYEGEMDKIRQRCLELIALHPDKAEIFQQYIKKQEIEYQSLENEITCSTMVLARC